MGYRGDVLMVQFCLGKISKRKASVAMTVANACEHQEAIAVANTHGGKFYVTGGKHTMSNDTLKAAEINRRKRRVSR
jgi:hypothetical protein